MGALLLLLALAADPQLEALRSRLEPMRSRPKELNGPRGATPELTEIKHHLRDWIESRLKSLGPYGDLQEFQRSLNQELRAARLICDRDCPDWFQSGFVSEVALEWESGHLVIRAGVGIACGYDHSVYVYRRSEDRFVRIWQHEQNKYTEADYKPQLIESIQIGDGLILILGRMTWCSSNWHDVYYRLFRLDSETPILNGSEWAWINFSPSIRGRLENNGALIEFTLGSIDGGVHNRQAVRRFEVADQIVRRVPPVALRPSAFVEEWLTNDWKDSSQWTEAPNVTTMSVWHRKLAQRGEFRLPTTHCTSPVDVWQVAADLPTPTYFLVRWRPPYRFSMVRVSSTPSPTCKEPDPEADAFHSLFFNDQR